MNNKKDKLNILNQVPLFHGIKLNEAESMLSCLKAQKKAYKKNEVILMSGKIVSSIGIILSGKVQIIREDIMGNRTIQAELTEGSLFAEAFSCAQMQVLPVTVISAQDSDILFIDFKRIISSCSNTCEFHTRLIENMLYILANKNILLNQKIEHISKRTIRGKLLSYLSSEAAKCGKSEFSISFNRQELADFLCTDRSAMSNELSKMRDEGILTFNKNHFKLLRTE